MSTSMYRLQISLPHTQVEFLRERAKSKGSSIAKVIRDLIARESEKEFRLSDKEIARVKSMAGKFQDLKPLIRDLPVGQHVDLYLTEAMLDTHSAPKVVAREKKASYRVKRAKTGKRARAKR